MKQLQEVVGRLNPTEIQFRVQWPGMPHEQVMQSLKLLATEVIPVALSSRKLRVKNSAAHSKRAGTRAILGCAVWPQKRLPHSMGTR